MVISHDTQSQKGSFQGTEGSGQDADSDAKRLRNLENFRDKMNEDSFPASDPPSYTPRANWRKKVEAEKESEH